MFGARAIKRRRDKEAELKVRGLNKLEGKVLFLYAT